MPTSLLASLSLPRLLCVSSSFVSRFVVIDPDRRSFAVCEADLVHVLETTPIIDVLVGLFAVFALACLHVAQTHPAMSFAVRLSLQFVRHSRSRLVLTWLSVIDVGQSWFAVHDADVMHVLPPLVVSRSVSALCFRAFILRKHSHKISHLFDWTLFSF